MTELRGKVKDYFDTHNLSTYGNTRSAVKAFIMIALYLLPYVLMVTGVITSVPGILISWIIMGFGMAGVGMGLMHDANHRTSSKHSAVNNWLGRSLYLLGGFPPNWRYQHNTMHHGYTNVEGHDEDIAPTPILRFSPHKPLYKIHRFQHFYAWFFYGLMTITWSINKDFMQLARYKKENVKLNSPKKYSGLFADLIISKVIYYTIFMVIPLLVIPVAWYWIVISFLAMHFVSGFILGIVFQTAHVMPSSEYPLPDEKGSLENNWAVHQLMTTTDYSPKSRILSWFVGGLNFQIEHHLFPNINHIHYKKLSPIVKETALKYNLPYNVQPNFPVALLNHYRMLRALGR